MPAPPRHECLLHPGAGHTKRGTALVAIVVAIIPITVMMPTTIMFIPPLPALSPAPLASFVQLVAPVFGLPAVKSVALDGLVELVLGMRGTAVTIGIVAGCARRARKQVRRGQRGCEQ